MALVVTERAQQQGLPLDPDTMLSRRGGQVRGLNRAAVQRILEQGGIGRLLAAEGGRTSRGSLDNMRAYVAFLNKHRPDLEAVLAFWLDEVRAHFAQDPLNLSAERGISMRALVQDILAQALERQRQGAGQQVVGTVIQHLVGAKLDVLLGEDGARHHSASTSDAQGGRDGDFRVGDTAIHVSTAPSEALLARCQANIRAGLRPVIVTVPRSVAVTEYLADGLGISTRLEVLDIEQFVSSNLLELGRFEEVGRREAIRTLVTRYNALITNFEHDTSLLIALPD